jgi:Glycosyltransferase family 87/WD40-like Beta Propeller Repeat
MTWSQSSLRRIGIPVLAICGLAYFLCTDFRRGWNQSTTDFPNYYTAARLVHSGEHLRNFYDWTWFQRQMNYAGIERQLGAYIPQPPLTMVPMLPIAGFAPQTAKRIWLVVNLVLLGFTAWLLSKAGRLRIQHIALLTLAGYTSLRTNFLLGQYYVFLLFLLTATFCLIARKKPISSGVAAGFAFALKLYGGPLLLYFGAKRYWKAVAGMIGATAVMTAVAVAIFGWADVWFYAAQVLPRTLEGVPPDPYNPGIQVTGTLLRRLFLADPELNPNPFYNAPWLLFFLQPLVSLIVVVFVSLAVALNRAGTCRRDFAIFTIALFLISTSVASYTFLLLLLPIVLCLEEAGPRESLYLVASYILLNAPLPGAHLFPKIWLLAALLVVAGRRYWPVLTPRIIAGTLAGIVALAALKAQRSIADYRRAPDKRDQLVSVERGSLFVTFPAISRAGLFCQAQTRDRYVLRWQHGQEVEDFSFEGQAFHPVAPDPAGPIYFELVAHASSRMMEFNPSTRKAVPVPGSVNMHPSDTAKSPDGARIAFASDVHGSQQIFIRNVATGELKRLTGGNCNNSEPAWELNGKAIVFASDCGRAVGLSALYRVDVEVTR